MPFTHLWPEEDRRPVKKGAWTAEEDAKLMEQMKLMKDREFKWKDVARCIDGRTGKQCRERWNCNLNPEISREPWTPEEDRTLLRLHRKVGNKWSQIAVDLSGRSENAVKTRFKSIERAAKKEWTEEEDDTLLHLYATVGPKWDIIAAHLPRRSRHGAKLRHQLLKSGDYLKIKRGAANQTLLLDRFGDRARLVAGDKGSSKSSRKRRAKPLHHDVLGFEALLELRPKKLRTASSACGSWASSDTEPTCDDYKELLLALNDDDFEF